MGRRNIMNRLGCCVAERLPSVVLPRRISYSSVIRAFRKCRATTLTSTVDERGNRLHPHTSVMQMGCSALLLPDGRPEAAYLTKGGDGDGRSQRRQLLSTRRPFRDPTSPSATYRNDERSYIPHSPLRVPDSFTTTRRLCFATNHGVPCRTISAKLLS